MAALTRAFYQHRGYWSDSARGALRDAAEDVRLERFCALIEANPVLAFRIIEEADSLTVNSEHRIQSVAHAIAVLGLRWVRSLVREAVMELDQRNGIQEESASSWQPAECEMETRPLLELVGV